MSSREAARKAAAKTPAAAVVIMHGAVHNT